MGYRTRIGAVQLDGSRIPSLKDSSGAQRELFSNNAESGVYLIHIHPPLGHAKHYIGYADDILVRLRLHRKGQGSRLLQVAIAAGSNIELACCWPGKDRHFEKALKCQKHSARYCHFCGGRNAPTR